MVGGMPPKPPPPHRGGPCQSGSKSSGLKFNQPFEGDERNIDRYAKAWKDAGYSYCGITPDKQNENRRHYILYKENLEDKIGEGIGKQGLMRDMSEHIHLFEDPKEQNRVCAIPSMEWAATGQPGIVKVSDEIKGRLPLGSEINLVEAPVGSAECGKKKLDSAVKVLKKRRDAAYTSPEERERYGELLSLGDVGKQISAYNRAERAVPLYDAITTPRNKVKDAQQKLNFRPLRESVKSIKDARDHLFQVKHERDERHERERTAAAAKAADETLQAWQRDNPPKQIEGGPLDKVHAAELPLWRMYSQVPHIHHLDSIRS